MTDWLQQVDADPYASTDETSVKRVLELTRSADAATRDAAIDALASVVKALEDEPVPASHAAIRAALPDLTAGLVEGAARGSAISLLRRVRPDGVTVARILELIAMTPPERCDLLAEALGLCEREAWSDAVESALCALLPVPNVAHAAAYALYVKAEIIRCEATAHALDAAARNPTPAGRHALHALISMLHGPIAPMAALRLTEILAEGSEPIRVDLARVLGWRASDAGLALLCQAAGDPADAVRASVATSLARSYAAAPEGRAALARLAQDLAPAVRAAAGG